MQNCQHDDCSSTLLLAPALERFRREALPGVVDTGRYKMPYFAWGEGPPLIFVHGLCDDAASFMLPIARLSRRFCCIAYDQPLGQNDDARLAPYRHDHLVEDLNALVDHLGLSTSYLFGSSFGSTIVLTALQRGPGRFPRGIVQGGFARRRLAVAEMLLARFARYWPGQMAHLPGRAELLHLGQGKPFAQREPAMWDYFLERSGHFPIATVARRALLVDQVDLRPQLPTIRQPILMICGDQDGVIDKTCEQDLLRGLPHVSRAEIEGCGHVPQFTHPEILSELVERFLGMGEASPLHPTGVAASAFNA